jgi:hypothetical protein
MLSRTTPLRGGFFFGVSMSVAGPTLQSRVGPDLRTITHNSFGISVAFFVVRLYILLPWPSGVITTRTGL